MSATTANSLSPPNSLFVYGTLMTGQSRHPMLEAGKITKILPASISGKLIDFGDHPGLYLSTEIKSRVHGEVIEFDALDLILSKIDEEEGAAFKREIVNVTLDTGHGHFAWTYVLAQEEETKPEIASGNWRAKTDG